MSKEYVVNENGIRIFKCCGSCAHKYSGYSKCTKTQAKCLPFQCCALWEIRQGLQTAGKQKGLVKRPEYIQYVAKVRTEEARKKQVAFKEGKKKIQEAISTDKMRRAFFKQNGNFYL